MGARTVIFDLDGTLADTSGDLIAAANACFRGMGLGEMLDPVADAGTALHGGRAMLTLGLERAEGRADVAVIDREYPKLLAHYAAEIDTHTRLFPGVEAAIAALHGAGVATGICTNKPEALAETLMTRLGVRELFASLIGADTLPVKKPDPTPFREAVLRAGGDPARAVLIGDTQTDRDTARAAGVPAVLVAFGPNGGLAADLAPEAVLEHFDALPALVARLLGD